MAFGVTESYAGHIGGDLEDATAYECKIGLEACDYLRHTIGLDVEG